MSNGSAKDVQDAEQQTSSRHKGMTFSTNTNMEPKRKCANRRRERPRKLRVFTDELPHNQNLYEPNIDSFVSTCAPGVSFGNNNSGTIDGNKKMSPKPTRSTPIHKRRLPSLSFLATTTIAAEKKKLKIEEEKRKELIAEMEARKALALNPIDSMDVGETKEDMSSNLRHSSLPLQSNTTVIENTTSNVTMPPLLEQFLMRLNEGGEKGEVDN
jgi:hypothetical protein